MKYLTFWPVYVILALVGALCMTYPIVKWFGIESIVAILSIYFVGLVLSVVIAPKILLWIMEIRSPKKGKGRR